MALLESRVGLLLGLSLISLGTGGIKPCVIALIGDQIDQVMCLLYAYRSRYMVFPQIRCHFLQCSHLQYRLYFGKASSSPCCPTRSLPKTFTGEDKTCLPQSFLGSLCWLMMQKWLCLKEAKLCGVNTQTSSISNVQI